MKISPRKSNLFSELETIESSVEQLTKEVPTDISENLTASFSELVKTTEAMCDDCNKENLEKVYEAGNKLIDVVKNAKESSTPSNFSSIKLFSKAINLITSFSETVTEAIEAVEKEDTPPTGDNPPAGDTPPVEKTKPEEDKKFSEEENLNPPSTEVPTEEELKDLNDKVEELESDIDETNIRQFSSNLRKITSKVIDAKDLKSKIAVLRQFSEVLQQAVKTEVDTDADPKLVELNKEISDKEKIISDPKVISFSRLLRRIAMNTKSFSTNTIKSKISVLESFSEMLDEEIKKEKNDAEVTPASPSSDKPIDEEDQLPPGVEPTIKSFSDKGSEGYGNFLIRVTGNK